MTTIQITVIDVAAPMFIKTAKGGYNAIEVAYKKDGKVEGKKILDFVNKEIFKVVQSLKAGETYDVTIEKDKNDYWQWVGVSPAEEASGGGGEGASVSPGAGAAVSRPVGRVTGSNYATSEERARTQVLIGRQSSVNYALQFMNHNNPKGQYGLVDLFDTAELINSWVVKGNAMQAVMDIKDDVLV